MLHRFRYCQIEVASGRKAAVALSGGGDVSRKEAARLGVSLLWAAVRARENEEVEMKPNPRPKVELVEDPTRYEIRFGGEVLARYASWRTSEARAFAAGVRAGLRVADAERVR
jgi:hypothetical protein